MRHDSFEFGTQHAGVAIAVQPTMMVLQVVTGQGER
jgi:hypothetical protein